jgi:hypothetical protein
MDAKAEKLLQDRDRCLKMAELAPTEAVGTKLLQIAHLYEVEAELTERARRLIAESKDLIAKADTILNQH